jgi:putative ABC transport system substrate-binding protein
MGNDELLQCKRKESFEFRHRLHAASLEPPVTTVSYAARGLRHRMNIRRLLVFAFGASFAWHKAPLQAQTTAGTIRRIGVLAPSTQAKEEIILKPFFDQMRQLGWIEGQNIAYDRVYADDHHQDLPRLAAELVVRKPELIYAPPQPAALAARQATRTIPIVFATGADPVGNGLVASLAHPGGNATGVVSAIESLAPKRIEMLPAAKRVGFLRDPGEAPSASDTSRIGQAGAALGLTIIWVDMASAGTLDAAVAKLIGQRVEVIFATSSLAGNLRERLIELANQSRVPVVLARGYMVQAGALFAYSSSLADQLRRSAQVADKVLKGANPADLAVEQPTRFELVINLKAAKALGITIPRSVLLRADEVIE